MSARDWAALLRDAARAIAEVPDLLADRLNRFVIRLHQGEDVGTGELRCFGASHRRDDGVPWPCGEYVAATERRMERGYGRLAKASSDDSPQRRYPTPETLDRVLRGPSVADMERALRRVQETFAAPGS